MYIVIFIYKNESLGYDLRVVAGPENFRPSGGGCTVQEDERQKEEMLAQESAKFVDLVARYRQAEAELENPRPGTDVAALRQEARSLAKQVEDQEKIVDMLDGAENPAETDMGDDPFLDNASFMEIPQDAPAPEKTPCPSTKELWPETNYQDYNKRITPLFPTLKGKVLITDLLVKMDEPVDSKLYLPRPLEMYTVEELKKVIPKNMSWWNNWYKDPLEPAKSWTWDEFTEIYNKPDFHFMMARVAQIGPQSKDPKLSMLCSKLMAQWKCTVTIVKMDPRQDWMLCTVPSRSDREKDALKYDLFRLLEGSAVYVIRRFAPAGQARDLEWVVKGSLADDNTIYMQMWKRLLEFEMGNTCLGWRVMGIRKAGTTSKFRGTFILDSPSMYWPWTMDWGHKHSSILDPSPLLNFKPTWAMKRPYACQCCHSMDHFMEECPLPFMKVGGTSLVSHPARTLVLKKKAGECIISLEKSAWELPVPCTPVKTPACPAPHAKHKAKTSPQAPLSVVLEERDTEMGDNQSCSALDDTSRLEAAPPLLADPPFLVIDNLVKFLLLRLHGNITNSPGLTEAVIQLLCKKHKGSLPAVLTLLCTEGWLLASILDQVMSFEYDRFIMGSPSPQIGGMHLHLRK